jgi:hypothetical protein
MRGWFRRRLITQGQLAFQRHALELIVEVFDPILGLLAVQPRHDPGDCIRTAYRVEQTVFWMVVDHVADFELVGHSFRQLSAETVRFFHFARITQRVRRAIMLIMQENGEL